MTGPQPNPNPDLRRTSENATPANLRCVLLSNAPSGPPADLLTSLSRRQVAVTVCEDAFGAMAAIVRGTQAGGADSGRFLVVAEPDSVARADELAAAVERFCPQVACWRYEGGAHPQLRGFRRTAAPGAAKASPEQAARPAARAPHDAANGVGSPARAQPRLRLAGADDEPLPVAPDAGDDEPAAGPAKRPADLLSEEELHMLLSDEPVARPRDGGGAPTP